MATVDFTVTQYGRSRGSAAGTIRSSKVRTSGQDTITTAENIEDASGDIVLSVGEVFAVHSDLPLRVSFGGIAATGTTGHYIPGDVLVEIEVADAGFVSAIEAT